MQQQQPQQQRRYLSFSYAGPRSLREILKVDLFESMEASEISDLWLSHHEAKVRNPLLAGTWNGRGGVAGGWVGLRCVVSN
jgi:hypothetical protein